MAQSWLIWFLLLTSGVGALGPAPGPARQPSRTPQQAEALQQQLAVLRDALELYHREHNGSWPTTQIVIQLTFPPDFSGMAGTQYGPYVHYGQFINPVNRLAWVMSVAEMLPRPTGTTGWIYAPQTGEIRANLLGVDPFGRPWFKY